MSKCIAYTPHGGGVAVCHPAPDCMRQMGSGGRDWMRGTVDKLIARSVAQGRYEWASARFVRALAFGGCTEAEALAIIRDRDCAHLGKQMDLLDVSELPDRWFRNAWRRSHNGGPIYVDLHKARRLQLDKIKSAVSERNRKRVDLGRKPIVPAWGEIGNAIRHARDEHELRRVWA